MGDCVCGKDMTTLCLTKHRSGILLKYGTLKIGLDVGLEDGLTLLSHSHADHVTDLARARHVVTTEATLETLRVRGGKTNWTVSLLEYGENLVEGNIRVTSLNAGHVLGSSMFLIEIDNGPSILYTGDFNVVDSVVHSAAMAVEADVLVTEATYGAPKWIFPERSHVHTMIVDSANEVLTRDKIPCFKVYSLGKAQETIAVLQNAGIDVISGNRVIDAVTAVYNQYGAGLRLTPLPDCELMSVLETNCAIVMSSRAEMSKQLRELVGAANVPDLERRLSEIVLTGWALHRLNRGHRGIPLSAHSDFPGLIRFAESVQPRIVYTFTDNASRFANHLADRGIQAIPI